jgi:predicted dehydrogenase
MASRLDDRYELVAGVFSSDPDRAKASATDLLVPADRAYDSYQTMATSEAVRDDGIDAVAIVTPNHVHYPVAKAFLDAGIHVICDKPLTNTLDEAMDLVASVERTGLVFGLTHNYTGYPMVRQMREMVAVGELGTIRLVQAEYVQDWLTTNMEASGSKQAEWRTDPARSGAAGCVGDIGTHAYNLANFVTGLEPAEVLADLSIFGEGRRLDDNAGMLLRYANGARGMLWASQVAPGNENALCLRVYGDKAGLTWAQEHPNHLTFTPYGEPSQTITRAGAGTGDAAAHASRVPAGHPEGYLEGFSQLYTDLAEQITAKLENRAADPASLLVPTVVDGAVGVKFIEAAVASSAAGGAWTSLALPVTGG